MVCKLKANIAWFNNVIHVTSMINRVMEITLYRCTDIDKMSIIN